MPVISIVPFALASVLIFTALPLAADPCKETARVCSQGPETRYIDTYPVYRECWQYETVSLCESEAGTNTCEALEKSPACRVSDSTCLVSPKPGLCEKTEYDYRCEEPVTVPESVTALPVEIDIADRFDEARYCTPATDPVCSQVERLCTKPDETHTIDGTPVTLSCWEMSLAFSCERTPANPSCSLLREAGCEETTPASDTPLASHEHHYLCQTETPMPEHPDIGFIEEVMRLVSIRETVNECEALSSCPTTESRCERPHPLFTDVCLTETQTKLCTGTDSDSCRALTDAGCELAQKETLFEDYRCSAQVTPLPDYIAELSREESITGMTPASNCPGALESATRSATLADTASACTVSSKVCVEPGETRLINGEPVYKDCWRWEVAYACREGETLSTCNELAKDPACELLSSTCLAETDGYCTLTNRTYRCKVSSDTVIEKEECTESICVNGLCSGKDEPPNRNLTDVTAKLEIGRQAAVYGDYENLRFFTGEAQTCRQKLGGVSCCRGKVRGGYANSDSLGASYVFAAEVAKETVKTLGSPYVNDILMNNDTLAPLLTKLYGDAAMKAYSPSLSYYGLSVSYTAGELQFQFNPTVFFAMVAMDVALDYATCTPEEQALQLKKGANLCRYLGSRCTQFNMGLCQIKEETYCCYRSSLARLVQEAAHEALGLSWGTPAHPLCSGLTAHEFATLDLSGLDLTELKSAMTDNVAPTPAAENTALRAASRQKALQANDNKYLPMPGKEAVSPDNLSNGEDR